MDNAARAEDVDSPADEARAQVRDARQAQLVGPSLGGDGSNSAGAARLERDSDSRRGRSLHARRCEEVQDSLLHSYEARRQERLPKSGRDALPRGHFLRTYLNAEDNAA